MIDVPSYFLFMPLLELFLSGAIYEKNKMFAYEVGRK